jgi:large subunit ribosomal protein L21
VAKISAATIPPRIQTPSASRRPGAASLRVCSRVATLPPLAGLARDFLVMSYAIIAVGGKQYRVEEGERLLVDRVETEPGKTFTPRVLLAGGDGKATLDSKLTVTARVVEHVRGKKVRIGKYRPKTGYRRHTGFRAALSAIEIESIGTKRAAASKPQEEEKATTKPRATAEKKAPARKPAAKETEKK